MADALVSIVLEKLGSIDLVGIPKEVRSPVEVEIGRLTHTLTIIQGVLEDAEEKQMKNKAVKLWLEEFKDISYDAEDILDKWRTRSLILNVDLNASVIKKVRSQLLSPFSCFKPIITRFNAGNKIKALNERLVGVDEKKQLYNLRGIRSNEQLRSITSGLVLVEEIYGRDVDKELILTKLLDESVHHYSHVPVISIVGTGGFGKTTLAQLILEQTKQLSKFHMHMWVCVSDPFNLEKVAKEIIEQAKGEVPNTLGWPMLHNCLYKSVREKCFFLVLDDVWPHNSSDWRQLKQALNGGAKGSRILITTRDERVANMMDSSYTRFLGPLSNSDCWSLFKRIAFFGREDDLDKFRVIGKGISKKCNGVPLVAMVIANLMRYKKTEQEWHAVFASNIWEVQADEEGFLPSILLSYNALPSYLKACLMYCAVFPKYSKLRKEEMVKLWMAQGYLGSDGSGSRDLEMIGRDYFDNLVMRSFFHDIETDDEGNITGCKMHNFVHDFVQSLTKNETIILEAKNVSSVNVRHLCAVDLDWSSIYQQKNLRTLRIHLKKNITLAQELLHELTCLRVLSLPGCGVKELPSDVEQLLLLRYLDLSDNYMLEILPETICNLLNLQTLKLKRCKFLTRLPEGIGKLSKLRHLEVEGSEFRPYYSHGGLRYFPPGIGRLTCLRTLDTFIVGVIDAQKNKEGCTLGDLKFLNHLEGHLKICGLGQVTDVDNVAQAELKMKEMLLSLELDFGWKQEKEDEVMRMEGILEDLQPHTNMEKLVIKYYQGIRLPSWISSLSNLTVLTLMDLHQCLQLPALGKLPTLEFLHLHGLISVKKIGCEFYGLDDNLNRQVIFPNLKKLILSSLANLEELELAFQHGVDFFPNLCELIITGFFPNLRKLRSGWLPGLLKLPGLGKLNSLETLELSRMDVGDLSCSFLPLLHDNPNNYPNLNYFKISDSSQSSLPKGFNLLTSIRQLVFHNCEFLDFMADDLKHLTMLKQLEISSCRILAGRFSKGDISSSSSHYYKIFIRQEQQKPTEIEESSHSDLEKSYQSDVNVHRGIFGHNREMYPIDVMRNTPEVLNCYNTPSKHRDLANRHHTKGHTFEHISNCGDSSGPLHSDDTSEEVEGGLLV